MELDGNAAVPAAASVTAPAVRVLEVADVGASQAFYRDVLGFELRSTGADADPRAATELARGPARLQLVPVSARPGTRQVVFFQVADLASLHARLQARGAAPSERTRVNWIKYEVFELRDPDDHTLWFGQSFDRPYESGAEPMLEKALPMLPCQDVAAAVAYYGDVLGFHIDYQQHDLGVMYRDDVTVLLVPRGQPATFGAAEFYIRDADALYRELAGRGAAVQGEPVSHPWGLRDFVVLDPDGNRLVFAQPFE